MFFLVNSQIQEMNLFQQNLIDLERTQQIIKKQYVYLISQKNNNVKLKKKNFLSFRYEEEIARLRQQLDQQVKYLNLGFS